MKKSISVIIAVCLAAAFSGYSLAAEAGGAAELIRQSKLYIEEGSKEAALARLDAAFAAANSSGDSDALMEIGDLYLKVDSGLKDKALEAWTAAGRMKCR